MPSFQPVDFDPFAAPSGLTPGGVPIAETGRPRVVIGAEPPQPKFKPVDHDPFAGPSVVGDVAKSAGIGVVKGGIGMMGMLGDLTDLGSSGIEAASNFVNDTFGQPRYERPKGSILDKIPTSADIQKGVEGYTGEFYKPKTTEGEYAQTAGEFWPALVGGGAGIPARLARTIIPAVTSETAGQVTKGTRAEPVARFLGALAGGGVTALASRPGNASRSISQQLPEGISEQMVVQADNLMQDAATRGVQLAWPEALSQVAGRPVLTNMMRHLEASPQTEARMASFFGDRPQRVEGAVRSELDNIAPANYAPDNVGPDAGAIARRAIQESPEGRILDDTMFQAGPRVSPEQAGNTMQQELRNVYDRREGMRSALADQDYAAARNAPATIPQNGGHRLADVTTHYLDRADIPIILDPAERATARTNWLDANNPTSRTAIIGERPTQFSQVDAGPVLEHLDNALGDAKGAVRQGLQAAKNALMRPDGSLDTTVAGLHNSRVAIDDLISQAKLAGANHTVSQLQTAKQVLDQTLENVPAYGRARQNFRAASQPLEPFGDTRTPGRIIERDQYNQRNVMPADRAPYTVQQGGPEAVRDFNSVATPAAREAFEQHIVTQVLDQATKNGTPVSAESIRSALRQNEDVLRQYPGVRDRLESIAIARDGLARVEQLTIGKIAKRDQTTKQAVDALFPDNPLPNSQVEIAQTMSELSRRNPNVAGQLVRVHAESVFNNSAKDLQSGANQAGGAKFRARLIGNPQQATNLQAAVEALPHGAERWEGFNRLLDVLEATGTRQGVGSRTTYNAEINKAQGAGGLARDAAKVGLNPLKAAQPLIDRFEQYKLGRNLDQLANVLTDPGSVNLLRAIARAPANSGQVPNLALRLATFANASRPEAPRQVNNR